MNATLGFGEYQLNAARYELTRHGRPIRLERISMELLLLLLKRRPDLVTREEILTTLWGKDASLDADNAINTAISKIRTALRDSAEGIVFIKMVPAKGYRFIAPVTVVAEEPDAPRERVTIPPPPPPIEAVSPDLETESGASTPTVDRAVVTRTRWWTWPSLAAAAVAAALGGWIARIRSARR